MRGRKPKPTVLHQLAGTTNVTRHRARKHEPKAVGALLADPPDWMTPSQQSGWRYVFEHAPAHVLMRIDRGILAIWVEAEDRHRIATITQAKLDQDTKLPLLIRVKDGPPIASPYISILTKTALVMMKAGSELGFSPASRPRITMGDIPVSEGPSPWDQLRVIDGGKKG